MDTSNYFRLVLLLEASFLATLISFAHGMHHSFAEGRRRCHCANDVACDVTTGRCPGGACATSWWGYTCQSEMMYQGCYGDVFVSRDVSTMLSSIDATNTPQHCAERCIALNYTVAAVQFSRECFCDNTYGQYGASSNCNMVCSGDSSQICGGVNANSVYELLYQVPSHPVSFRTTGGGMTHQVLIWDMPTAPGGIITHYEVNCMLILTYKKTQRVNTIAFKNTTVTAVRNITVKPLFPGSSYRCSVAAVNGRGRGKYTLLYFTTLPSVPGNPAKVPQVANREETTAEAALYPADFTGGPLYHALVVGPVPGRRRRRQVSPGPYVTAVYLSPKGDFSSFVLTVGDNSTSSLPWTNVTYKNRPLQAGTTYTIGHVMFSSGQNITIGNSTVSVSFVAGYTAPPPSPSTPGVSTGVIAGVSGAGLLLVCGVVALAVIFMRRRRKQPANSKGPVVREKATEDTELQNVAQRREGNPATSSEAEEPHSYEGMYTDETYEEVKAYETVKGVEDPSMSSLVESFKTGNMGRVDLLIRNSEAIQEAFKRTEAFLKRTTAVPQGQFRTYRAQLQQEEDGLTLLQRQFLCLEVMKQRYSDEQLTVARRPGNRLKNRDNSILPANGDVIFLKHGQERYINAVFVDGYRRPRAFLVTQTPLPATTADLLQLVLDRGVSHVVSLDSPNNHYQVLGAYWSEGVEIQVGDISVRHLSTETRPGLTARVLLVTAPGKLGRTVTQLEYEGWEDGETPPDTSSVIRLVHELHDLRATETPVLIHCNSGVERCGVVVGLSHLVERLEQERTVDVYHTVKTIRASRPQFITSPTQYEFLHQAANRVIEQQVT